jgi:hypothetical protein
MARENKGLRGFLLLILLQFSGEQNGHLPLKRKGGHTASNLNCKVKEKYYDKTHVNV